LGAEALEHEDGVGRTGQPERAGHCVESVVGLGLAPVMHQHERASNSLKSIQNFCSIFRPLTLRCRLTPS
jgi:hypothetical protein